MLDVYNGSHLSDSYGTEWVRKKGKALGLPWINIIGDWIVFLRRKK